jgi:hypothetical protein
MEWAFASISQLARGGSTVLVFAFGTIGLAQAQVAVPLINPLQFVYLQPSTVQRPLSFSVGSPRSDFELFDTGSFVYSAAEPPNLTAAFRYTIRAPEQLAGSQFLFPALVEGTYLYANWPCIQQPGRWQLGGGGVLCYQCWNEHYRFALHYGTVFNGPRESFEGDHSVGLQVQFHFGKRNKS